jgi:mRNA-degrading endonuclease toxin of MazEF toxin-antitoxin module
LIPASRNQVGGFSWLPKAHARWTRGKPGMPGARRGEVRQFDFGLVAKVRPALGLGCDTAEEDRVLVAAVHHTTALRGSRCEVPTRVAGLDDGGFDAQSLCTISAVKLSRRRTTLNPAQMKAVEEKVKPWLGLD